MLKHLSAYFLMTQVHPLLITSLAMEIYAQEKETLKDRRSVLAKGLLTAVEGLAQPGQGDRRLWASVF